MHTNPQDVEYDSAKAVANEHKHGVSFADAEQALRDLHAATMEDPDAESEARFITLGMDAKGRVLVIVWTPRGDKARIVSARKASRNEARIYAQ